MSNKTSNILHGSCNTAAQLEGQMCWRGQESIHPAWPAWKFPTSLATTEVKQGAESCTATNYSLKASGGPEYISKQLGPVAACWAILGNTYLTDIHTSKKTRAEKSLRLHTLNGSQCEDSEPLSPGLDWGNSLHSERHNSALQACLCKSKWNKPKVPTQLSSSCQQQLLLTLFLDLDTSLTPRNVFPETDIT